MFITRSQNNWGSPDPVPIQGYSTYPRQPRIYKPSKAWWFLGIIGVLMAVMFLFGLSSDGSPLVGLEAFVIVMLITLPIFIYVMGWRTGVDEDKIWVKFWSFYYREVRFDQITRLKTDPDRILLWSGKNKIAANVRYYALSLLHIRLIEESHKYKFAIDDVQVGDPHWEDAANNLRATCAYEVIQENKKYFEENPEELAKLKALAPTYYETDQYGDRIRTTPKK